MKANAGTLQALCRAYLKRLRYMAEKRGLGGWLKDTLDANERGECAATEKEVVMLASMVGEERVRRDEIPSFLGKSYTQCNDDEDFERIKKLPREGVYSKVSALLYADKLKNKKRKDKK